jgi:hypothetical protein
MKFKTEAVVTGVKFFDDNVEGKHYQSTTVYCLIDMDESRKNAKGQATAEYKHESPALFRKLQDLAFPVNCELVLDQVTNGKMVKTIVLDVRPLPSNQVPKAA